MSAVLFELDGTLLDLPVDIEPARREVERLLEEAGQGGPARPLLAAIDRAGDPELRAAARRILDAAELAAAGRARARPGAAAAVAALAQRGFRLGIVTDNGRACLAAALSAAGLEGGWHAVTRDDVERPKPAPDGVISAARALCPAGGALWFAGDSPRDVIAGRAAAAQLPEIRLQVVAVLGGHGGEEEIARAAPDHVVPDLEAFAALVCAR